jgi:hypothetical protein
MPLTFEAWMRQVDFNVYMLASCQADDIDDWLYYDDYQKGVKPRDSAKKALRNAGHPNFQG